MSTASNLYAEKIFAEHPIALWPLDDKADYVSLISESQRSVYNWTIDGGVAENYQGISDEPFPDSSTTIIYSTVPVGVDGSTECKSQNIINFTSFNHDAETFSIGAYVYASSSYIDGFEIGYEYYDEASGENVQVLKSFTSPIYNKWIFLSSTFDIVPRDIDIKIVLKINYLGGSTSADDYVFFVNGVSLGQWSEEFNSTSLGISKQQIPSNVFGTTEYGVHTDTYGLEESIGYYLINNNLLVAKNTGVPMVYGSSNVTFLYPNDSKPSLILPGRGFMNNIGKYKNYTLEMWLRVTNDSYTPKRIVGPIRSDDGIYVDGPFLRLKVGDNVGSHYVGEWSRPMLIHLKIINNSASLMINGDQVISLEYLTDELDFIDEYSGTLHNDWIGFYAYDDVSPIEVDSVAIYSYQIPSVVAKRRFVYGQGVEFPENINKAYSGTSVYVDYQFADYTNNYSYPDRGSWRQGVIDNLSTLNNTLTTPNYELPDLVLENIDSDSFLSLNYDVQNEDYNLITFKPSTTKYNGHLLFSKLNVLNEDVKALYGIFKTKVSTETQTLMFFENETTGNSFEVELTQDKINYKLYYDGETQTIYQTNGTDPGEVFSVGIHFENFGNYYGAKVSDFFANKSEIKFYVGGKKDFTKTFIGNIYKIGFCNEKNYNEVSFLFNDYGVSLDYENVFDLYQNLQFVPYDAGKEYFGNDGSYYLDNGTFVPNLGYYWEYVVNGGSPFDYVYAKLIEHTASYTLIPKVYFSNFILDIAVKGSWQDYLPLTYFAQYVKDSKDNPYYDLDFIQLNVDYPSPSKFKETETISEDGWTYAELQAQYGSPIQRTYEALDNYLFTGYEDYQDLKERSIKTYSYDTSSALIKSTITFQYLQDGANATDSYFINYVDAPKNGVVEPGEDWINTEYEVVDNMILYPPSGVNFEDLAVVVNLKFEIPGIISNPIKVRQLQLCSQAFNKDSSNPIGTRFGTPIYPYRKTGLYFNYKDRNPYTIYKSSSPYLYLTRYSGIQVKGGYDPNVNRGLSIPINQTKASNYDVIAMQIAGRFDEDFFPYAPVEIFELQSKNSTIKFYMVANQSDGKRAKIYAINANTGRLEDGFAFYLNGLLVNDPVITIKQWFFLGITFSSALDFNSYRGAIRINGPLLVNTISHYQSTNLQEVQTVSTRPWYRVKFAPPLTLDWSYWNAPSYKWQGVLVLSETSYYGVNSSDIYKSYTGTNKIIVNDPITFSLKNYEYSMLTEVSWKSNTVTAL